MKGEEEQEGIGQRERGRKEEKRVFPFRRFLFRRFPLSMGRVRVRVRG